MILLWDRLRTPCVDTEPAINAEEVVQWTGCRQLDEKLNISSLFRVRPLTKGRDMICTWSKLEMHLIKQAKWRCCTRTSLWGFWSPRPQTRDCRGRDRVSWAKHHVRTTATPLHHHCQTGRQWEAQRQGSSCRSLQAGVEDISPFRITDILGHFRELIKKPTRWNCIWNCTWWRPKSIETFPCSKMASPWRWNKW